MGVKTEEEESGGRGEERTLEQVNNQRKRWLHTCVLDNSKNTKIRNRIILLRLHSPGWAKEDCEPVLIHRESHPDPRQWEHQYRSPGILVIMYPLSMEQDYFVSKRCHIPPDPHSLPCSDRATTKSQLLWDGQSMGDLRLLRTVREDEGTWRQTWCESRRSEEHEAWEKEENWVEHPRRGLWKGQRCVEENPPFCKSSWADAELEHLRRDCPGLQVLRDHSLHRVFLFSGSGKISRTSSRTLMGVSCLCGSSALRRRRTWRSPLFAGTPSMRRAAGRKSLTNTDNSGITTFLQQVWAAMTSTSRFY